MASCLNRDVRFRFVRNTFQLSNLQQQDFTLCKTLSQRPIANILIASAVLHFPQALRLLSANIDSFSAISGSSFVRNTLQRSHRPKSHPHCRAEIHPVRNAFPSCHREYFANHRRVFFCLQCSDKVSSPIGIVPKPIISKLSISTPMLAFVLSSTLSSETQDSLPPPTSPFCPTTSHGPSAYRLIA